MWHEQESAVAVDCADDLRVGGRLFHWLRENRRIHDLECLHIVELIERPADVVVRRRIVGGLEVLVGENRPNSLRVWLIHADDPITCMHRRRLADGIGRRRRFRFGGAVCCTPRNRSGRTTLSRCAAPATATSAASTTASATSATSRRVG